MSLGVQLGKEIRQKVLAELGLRVSVGVARTCFLAKVASTAAKPDGLASLENADEVQAALVKTAVERLPGADCAIHVHLHSRCFLPHAWLEQLQASNTAQSTAAGYGGKVAQALRQHGITTAAELQHVSVASLQQLCGLSAAAAHTLAELAHGRDARIPAHKAPPKAISLQMTLTPVAIPMPAAWSADGCVSAVGGCRNGMLQPLLLDDDDADGRMTSLLTLMLRDLLIRVVQDRCPSSHFSNVLRIIWCFTGAVRVAILFE